MRKTYAIIGALAAVALLSACGSNDQPSGAPASSVPATASSEPTADTSGEVPADGSAVSLDDVTKLKVTPNGLDTGVPNTDSVQVEFNIKNSAAYAVTFQVTIAIFDSNGDQATAVGVNTSDSGPTLPGKTLHVSNAYITTSKLPKGPITYQVTEAQRQPA